MTVKEARSKLDAIDKMIKQQYTFKDNPMKKKLLKLLEDEKKMIESSGVLKGFKSK